MFLFYLLLTGFINPDLNNIKQNLKKHNSIKIYNLNNKALNHKKEGIKNYISPTLSFGIKNLPLTFSYQDSAMTGNMISIMQPFKWSDKFNKKRKIIDSKIDKNNISKTLFLAQNFIKISKSYYKIYFLNKKIEQLKK